MTVTHIPTIATLPYTEMCGPLACGSMEVAEKTAAQYGLSAYWCESNKQLFLIPKEGKNDDPTR